MSDITILEEIKLLASELSNMSPKTQLEIVKLCKNICLKTKDYLDGVVEDIEDETTRATAKENEIAGNLASEILRATAKENEIAGNLASEILRATGKENEIAGNLASEILRATGAENGLDTRITNLKNMIGFIEITNASDTLTDNQYAEALKPYCIISLNNLQFYFKEKIINNIITFSRFDFGNYSTYWNLRETYINVSQDKTYQLNSTSLNTNLYSKEQTDSLLNAKQNTLEFNSAIPSGITPTPLSNLKDGNNYYSLGGGRIYYRHDIMVVDNNTGDIASLSLIDSNASIDTFNNVMALLSTIGTFSIMTIGATGDLKMGYITTDYVSSITFYDTSGTSKTFNSATSSIVDTPNEL